MTTVGLCIPWRSTPSRERHLVPVIESVRAQARVHRIVLADSGHRVFNRGASMNEAVAGCLDLDVVIVTGADLILTDGRLAEVIEQAAEDHGRHIAYTRYRGLSQLGTDAWYRTGDVLDREVLFDTDGACGGFICMRPEVYTALGGHAEDFEGWGYEDTEFASRANLVKHPGTCLGLWHEPDDKSSAVVQSNLRRFQAHLGHNSTQQASA